MQSRAFALLRSAFFATLFVWIWTWFFPRWFARSKGVALEMHPNAVNVAMMIVGGLIMLVCMFQFGWTGRGTPAPFDPPRRLVVKGPYRWVRNPMYVGMGIFLVGEALLLPSVTREMLWMVAACAVAVTIFVMIYEEPTLRRLFGEDYIEYCRHVRRWIPRFTPWYAPSHLD